MKQCGPGTWWRRWHGRGCWGDWRTLALLVAVGTGFFPGVVRADDEFPYRGAGPHEGSIPSPAEFFGVPLGSRYTPHHDVERYVRYVAEKSPRAQFVQYGRTAEGRALMYLIISDAAHLGRIDEIRELQSRLADPRRGEIADLAALPAVGWLSYNVHGNEASCTEAALQTIYELVDGQSETAKKIRDNVVLILDPLLNPDGRERFLFWYHSVAVPGGNPDPSSREHDEPWPGGRSNHYYFDLNRDWAWQSQIETRCRIEHYLEWQPLVHVDFHEMSPESTYFFFPAEEPINKNYTDHTRRWGEAFGQANAAAFDRFGWLYYTAESFDLFYPGYGDSWPSLHGAIGMTYEQAGGPSSGLRYRKRSGAELTLRDRLHHHFVSSMATLECLADRRRELQESFATFRRTALEGPKESDGVVEYLFTPDQGFRLQSLVELLVRQGVEVEETTEEFVANSLTTYYGEEKELVKLPAGTVIVPLSQPAGRLAKALLEPNAEVSVNRFYDISAWSLPFAMGLEAFHSAHRVPAVRKSIESWRTATEGPPARAAYAYLLPWQGVPSARALHELQRRGVGVRLMPEKIQVGERSLPGCLQVLVSDESVHEAVKQVAESTGVSFVAVDTGWTEDGIDLGSEQVEDLAPPRIAIATGAGVSSGSFGAVWYLFEQELDIPFTAFELESFGGLRLSDYNVIILPDGFGYGRALAGSNKDALQAWVRQGGVLIAMGGAARALTKEASDICSISMKRDDEEKDPDKKVRRKIRELRERRRERQVPGNIFRVDLDQDHVLALGLPRYVFALMDSTESFAVSESESDVGAFTEDPALSGYISQENIGKLSRRIYLAEDRQGRGSIILFADDPNFRLFWRGLQRLFLNAVFLRSTP